MGIFMIPTSLLDHEAILNSGMAGLALHVAASAWCARNSRGKRIPAVNLAALLPDMPRAERDKAIADLVAGGLWSVDGECFAISAFVVPKQTCSSPKAKRDQKGSK